MPWDVRKRGSQWCVIKQGESSPVPGGCHASKEKARAHQRALYASETVSEERLANGLRFSVSEGSDMSETAASGGITFEITDPRFETITGSDGKVVGFRLSEFGTTYNTVTQEFETASNGDPVEKPWSGVLAVLGSPTSDKRFLIPGEISNRDLPIPLQVQTATSDGHGGAEVAGRIDQIDYVPVGEFDQRDEFNLAGVPDTAIVVYATGVLDGSPAAVEAERLIANGAGVSIDLPPDRLALIDPKTFEEVDPDTADMADVLSGKYLTGIGGKIAAATIVTIPAFEEAEIGVEEDSVLVASAYGQTVGFDQFTADMIEELTRPLVAAAAPLKPDALWFENPGLKKLTPLTITPEGRVYGHLADWDGCHTGFSNVCVPPFRSQTDYAYFNTGELECADGTMVQCGKLMFSRDGGKHAGLSLNWSEAATHYDDSTKVGAFVKAGTDRHGTWLAGCVHPGLTDEDLQHLRSHPPSGDWRPIPGKGTELVAAFCVPVPGFPIPRAMVASAGDGLTIISAPLDTSLGTHAVRRRFEMARRRRRKAKAADEDTSMVSEDTIWMTADQLDESEFAPTASQRRRWAKSGVARPDGSFPITKCTGPGTSAINARRAIGRANPGDREAVRRHIAKRERALGCSNE